MNKQEDAQPAVRKSQRASKPSEKARDLDAGSKLIRKIKKGGDTSDSVNRSRSQSHETDIAKQEESSSAASQSSKTNDHISSQSSDKPSPRTKLQLKCAPRPQYSEPVPPRPKLKLKYSPQIKHQSVQKGNDDADSPLRKRRKAVNELNGTDTKLTARSTRYSATTRRKANIKSSAQASDTPKLAAAAEATDNALKRRSGRYGEAKRHDSKRSSRTQASTCGLACLEADDRLYAVCQVAALSEDDLETQEELDAALATYCKCGDDKTVGKERLIRSTTESKPRRTSVDADDDTIVVTNPPD